MKRQAGFTLVELVVVIIILGVLAATALPKFISVSDDAHKAAVAGAGGSFGTAVALVKAQWIANGHTTAVDQLAGFGNDNVDTNTKGWPVATDNNNGNPSSTRCKQVWDSVLQGPPSVATSGTTTDYTVAANNSGRCTFTYNQVAGMSIIYESSNGSVTVDSTP